MNEDLEAVRQEHESFLAELESKVVRAIATGSWQPVLDALDSMIEENSFPPQEQQADRIDPEWHREAANRAALLQSLIVRRDWVACRQWLDQWANEDESITQKDTSGMWGDD